MGFCSNSFFSRSANKRYIAQFMIGRVMLYHRILGVPNFQADVFLFFMRLYHCHARWPKGRYLNLNVHGDWLRSSDSLNFSWRTFHARSMGVGPQCRSQFFPSLRIGQPHPDEFHTLWRWYPPKKRSPHGYETGDPPSIDFFCEVAHPSNPQIWWVLGNIPKVWNMVNVFVLCPNSSLIVSVANTHAMFNVLALHIYISIYIYI